MSSTGEAGTFFEAVGGSETFRRIVERFYEGVAQDPVLRPLYPEQDLGPAARRLQMFLEQYWGGPRTYSDERGHPRLRMRHGGWRIGVAQRDAWLQHMHDGVEAVDLPEPLRAQLWDYLVMAANSLLNVAEGPEEAGQAPPVRTLPQA